MSGIRDSSTYMIILVIDFILLKFLMKCKFSVSYLLHTNLVSSFLHVLFELFPQNRLYLPTFPYHDGGPYHMETSQLICVASQPAGFYMIGTSAMKNLSNFEGCRQTLLLIKKCKLKWNLPEMIIPP